MIALQLKLSKQDYDFLTNLANISGKTIEMYISQIIQDSLCKIKTEFNLNSTEESD